MMRVLHCRNCGKKLIELEKGVIVKAGVAIYCLDCDPGKAPTTTNTPPDFSELFRNLGNK